MKFVYGEVLHVQDITFTDLATICREKVRLYAVVRWVCGQRTPPSVGVRSSDGQRLLGRDGGDDGGESSGECKANHYEDFEGAKRVWGTTRR